MKKLNIFAMGLLLAAGFTSCSEDSFEELYPDPSKATQANCASLMTGTFYNYSNANNFADAIDYTYNKYWRMYTWDNAFGRFAQTIGYQNESGSMYYVSDSYANNRWDAFYRTLSQFRQLESVYNSQNGDDQTQNRIFKDCAEVFVYDHLSQIVDIFGDVPFTTAGRLGVTGSIDDARATFDDDVELYRTMIDRLGELYNDILALKLHQQGRLRQVGSLRQLASSAPRRSRGSTGRPDCSGPGSHQGMYLAQPDYQRRQCC